MKKTLSTLAFVTLAFSGNAFAQAQTYTIDNSHTFPSFTYNHMGFSQQTSKFTKTSGTIEYDKAANQASMNIIIDMKSVETGFAPFNEHIQGEDFLDTANYPTATFKSNEVLFEDGKPVKVMGELTIRDVTKPVTLTVTHFAMGENPMFKKEAIGANAYTTINRSEFNAGGFVPAVSDEVRINIAVEAIAK